MKLKKVFAIALMLILTAMLLPASTIAANGSLDNISKSFCSPEIQLGEWDKGKWSGDEWISVSEWHVLNGGTGDEQWYPKNQRIRWPVTFYVPNNTDEDWTDVVLKDHFGAELELLDMEYELDGITYEVEGIGVGNLNKDPQVDDKGIGFYTNKGASKQLRFIWEVGDLPAGEAHTLSFYVATDLNPGQGKKDLPKWEFTSCGIHTLNSGANLQWIDGAGAKQSESTEGWAIQVCKPTPVVTTEIQAPMISGVAYILIEDTVQDEAFVYSLEGVHGVNCDWYPAATGDVAFWYSEDMGATWTSWGSTFDWTGSTVTSDPVDFDEVGRYYLRAVFESADTNYSDSSSGDLDEPLEVIQLSMVVEKTGDELSKIGDLVDYTITVHNTSSGNVPPMYFDVVDTMLGINEADIPIALGDTYTINSNGYEIPVGADDPYVNEVGVHATVDGLPYEIDGDDSWETNLFQPSFKVSFAADDVVGVGEEITWEVTVENNSSVDSPDANVSIEHEFMGIITAVIPSGNSPTFSFFRPAVPDDHPQIEATLTVEITFDDFPNVFNFEETLITVVNTPPEAFFTVGNDTLHVLQQPFAFFDGSSDPDGDPLNYSWVFGDFFGTSTDQDPLYDYGSTLSSLGTYSVTLTVTDPYGASDSYSHDVTVYDTPPEAHFTVGNDSLHITQQPFAFFDDSSDPDSGFGDYITGWYWDFGDGNTSNDQNPTHDYTTPDTYTVTLVVTDSFGTPSDPYYWDVTLYNNPPVADFSVGNSNLHVNQQPFAFFDESYDDDPGDHITTWYWDFGDGSTDASNDPNPEHSYGPTPDTYTVTLVVTDSTGTPSAPYLWVVNVYNNPPVANFTVADDDLEMEQQPFQFYGSGSDPDSGVGDYIFSYYWNFGDLSGTSTDQNPTYSYTYPGTYTVTLVVTDSSGTPSAPYSHVVNLWID